MSIARAGPLAAWTAGWEPANLAAGAGPSVLQHHVLHSAGALHLACKKMALRAGVAVYSARAEPLAAWTAGWELANLAADADRACLVLETGVNARWRYGSYRRTPENTAEARAWQDAKGAVRCAPCGLRVEGRVKVLLRNQKRRGARVAGRQGRRAVRARALD